MTRARELLAELSSLGIAVVASGDVIRFEPAGAVTEDLRRRMREQKLDLLALLGTKAEARPGGGRQDPGPWPTATWGPILPEHFRVRTLQGLVDLPVPPGGFDILAEVDP